MPPRLPVQAAERFQLTAACLVLERLILVLRGWAA